MKEDIALQASSPIERFLSYLYDRPWIYVIALVGFGVYFWCRSNQDMNPMSALIVAGVVGVLSYFAFMWIAPNIF